jgi:hypothetical protein
MILVLPGFDSATKSCVDLKFQIKMQEITRHIKFDTQG